MMTTAESQKKWREENKCVRRRYDGVGALHVVYRIRYLLFSCPMCVTFCSELLLCEHFICVKNVRLCHVWRQVSSARSPLPLSCCRFRIKCSIFNLNIFPHTSANHEHASNCPTIFSCVCVVCFFLSYNFWYICTGARSLSYIGWDCFSFS